MAQPTQEDARLLLQIYDLRREARLRKARDFVGQQLKFKDYADFNKRYPPGSKAGAHVAMVLGYWDTVCTLVDKGLLNAELFQLTNFEHVSVWFKLKPLVVGWRKDYQYPGYAAPVEAVATAHPVAASYQQWAAVETEAKSKKKK